MQQALTIHREIGDRPGEGTGLGNLGNAYSALGEVKKAIEYYEQALALAREVGDRDGEARHLFNLGIALEEIGEKEKAIEYMEAALEIYEAIESPYAEDTRKRVEELRMHNA